MARAKTPLKWRNNQAQRDFVNYQVHYDRYHNGKESDQKYYISVSGGRPVQPYLTTASVRRFNTQEQAEQFCQDIYEGKIDLAPIRAEAAAIQAAKREAHDAAVKADADRFKGKLADAGVVLPVFLDLLSEWSRIGDDSHRLLYCEVRDPLEDEI